MIIYKDISRNRIVYVGPVPGGGFAAYYKRYDIRCSERRFHNPDLPVRDTQEEAEADLMKYSDKKRWVLNSVKKG